MSEQRHPVLFVGAGPGDPELITVAGRRALERADLVVYAGSLVPEEMLAWCRQDCERVSSAGLHLEQITGCMLDAWRGGARVVRLQTGDVSLYGALAEQTARLDAAGAPWRVVPGVTAAFAAAAALGLEYTLPETTQTLVITRVAGRTPVPAAEDLAALAGHGSSLCIYLSAGQGEKVGEALAGAFGAQAPVAVVRRASWPDQRVLWTTARGLAEDLAREEIDRQAVILAGPAVAALAQERRAPASRLYAAGFSHGWRRGGPGGEGA